MIFQDYKIGIIEIQNGRVLQTDLVDLDFKEFDVIPVYPDNRKYNRAKVKKETNKMIKKYQEREV